MSSISEISNRDNFLTQGTSQTQTNTKTNKISDILNNLSFF